MSENKDMQSIVDSISGSLEQLAVIETLKVKHTQTELASLIEKREDLAEAWSYAISKKMGDEQVSEATQELDDFDFKHPLIKKFLRFSR